ncbi:MAG TPA: VC0807 family protein [Acidimicrobiales bacterium]|nr:VC0807 family protein [Acidimicrobiales bacterium]
MENTRPRTWREVDGAGVEDGEGDPGGGDTLHLPSPRAVLRHALPGLIESTIGPGALFYLVLVTAGFHGAVLAALGWSYLAAARRLYRRERLSGLLVLGIVLVSLRTIVTFLSGSTFLYFIQPTAGTFLVGIIFLVTGVAGRPMVERLAYDFCPLDPELMKRSFLRKFFLRVSMLWAVVLTTNAAFVLMLLLRSSVQAFVVEKTVVSTVLTIGGIVLSVTWFVRAMRQHGIAVRFSGALQHMAAAAVPALVPVPVAGAAPVVVVDASTLD